MSSSAFFSNKVHILGSVPLSSIQAAFETLSTSLPNHLTRLPDGEPGPRGNFVLFQGSVFAKCQYLVNPLVRSDPTAFAPPYSSSQKIELLPTGYDEAAIQSYATFSRLRDEGVIPKHMRFMVALPGPLDVIALFVMPKYQVEVEKLYEASLLTALKNIQAHIPAKDLAIQWDLPIEMAYMEYAQLSGSQKDGKVDNWLHDGYANFMSKPWFSPVREGVLNRLKKLAEAVNEDVEMGFHLCYGDFGRQHFIEPRDTSILVELANSISSVVERDINWLHIPVPKPRVDREYYMPLNELKLRKETEFYLGLVHAGDEEGTVERMKVAHEYVEDFGVSTECGCGRRSEEEFVSILDITRSVTA